MIKETWDSLYFHYRKHKAPSLRRKCRMWGVIYEHYGRKEEEETEQVLDEGLEITNKELMG